MSETLVETVARHLMPNPPDRIGVAVSGGGDSVSLLCLLNELASDLSIEVHAITIDHGLREAALEEVRAVTDLCAELGVPHHVEFWKSWNQQGNLMAEARNARYGLLADWAQANDVGTIALGHTANDQAETMIMRLGRRAGVDGLSAMAPRRVDRGVVWLRPLLDVHRRDLRKYLTARGVPWVEDPTNEDLDFERVRTRETLRLLEPLGIDVDTLVDVAKNMALARDALDWQTFLSAKDIAKVSHGALAVDLRRFRTLPEEIRRRILVGAIGWLGQDVYPPRRAAVLGALVAIRDGRTVTLGGCQVLRDGDLVWFCRELNAIEPLSCEVGDAWDNRWVLTGPEDDPDYEVRALGAAGLLALRDWRESGIPRSVLMATPAVWCADELVAAPVAEDVSGWTARLEGGKDAFFAALLSH